MNGYDNWHLLPEHLRDGLARYLDRGLNPGSFLTAVLQNNLEMAIGHADEDSLAALPEIVRFFYNELPGNCWGSPREMTQWMAQAAANPGDYFFNSLDAWNEEVR
tara:strand:- start:458 stop:772 length:315 start_codon:yes stop_codon:yes gene_type:complete